MIRNNEALAATLDDLKAAGFEPVVTRSKHWKVKCDGLPPITVSVSANDPMAVHMARRTVRKIIALNRPLTAAR